MLEIVAPGIQLTDPVETLRMADQFLVFSTLRFLDTSPSARICPAFLGRKIQVVVDSIKQPSWPVSADLLPLDYRESPPMTPMIGVHEHKAPALHVHLVTHSALHVSLKDITLSG